MVGEIDAHSAGFNLGQAPDNARPNSRADGLSSMLPASGSEDGSKETEEKTAEEEEEDLEPRPYLTEDEAFDVYKNEDSEGKDYQERYYEAKNGLQMKKKALKSMSITVNTIKKEIDTLNAKLTIKRQENRVHQVDGVDVIDEEEYGLIRELKQKKQSYKKAYEQRQETNKESNYLKGLVEQTKIQLCNTFLIWYQKYYGGNEPTLLAGAGEDDDQSVLDDGEAFERLQMDRLKAEDPESVSYYNATKESKKGRAGPLIRRGQRPKIQ